MPIFTWADAYQSTLSATLTAGATTMAAPTSTTGAPSADPTAAPAKQFRLTIQSAGYPGSGTRETVTVTDSRTGTWTITAPANSYSSGDPVANTITSDVLNLLASSGSSIYGTSIDGDVTVSGGITTLSRDMFYRNLTIPSGQTIRSGGYRVYVSGTLTLNGTLGPEKLPAGWNGSSGAGSTVGGSVGGAGGTTAGSAAPGVGDAYGGQGGSGGAGASGAGGTSPTVTGPVAAPFNRFITAISAILFVGGFTATVPRGGTGGGGGGGDGTNTGGRGGPSAGVAYVYARYLAGTGVLQADGSDGAAATTGNCGGGGGGGGGAATLVTAQATCPFTVRAAGGAGGAGVGTGSAGVAGSAGAVAIHYGAA